MICSVRQKAKAWDAIYDTLNKLVGQNWILVMGDSAEASAVKTIEAIASHGVGHVAAFIEQATKEIYSFENEGEENNV